MTIQTNPNGSPKVPFLIQVIGVLFIVIIVLSGAVACLVLKVAG